MKVGIFSDVHGCLRELQGALQLLESLDVDHLVCAGDLVDKGPDSDGVVALMQSQSIPCVQGNHDSKVARSWLLYQQPLHESALSYLRDLPPSLNYEWVGIKVFVSHSNPWEDSSVYVYPSRPKALFEEIARAVDANVIILGHTHIPMCIEVDGTLILNPGAVYGNASSDSVYDRPQITRHTCAVLTLPELAFDVYDIATGEKVPPVAW